MALITQARYPSYGATDTFPWGTSDHDLFALQKASLDFLSDSIDGECACFYENSSGAVLPGENFLLYENRANYSLNDGHSTAESLFDVIEDIFKVDEFDLEMSDETHKDAFYSLQQQTYVSYTALDELVSQSSLSSPLASSDASDVSDNDSAYAEINELESQFYFDLASSSFLSYTALHQLLTDLGEVDVLPRIHRDDIHDDNNVTFDDLEVEISEIGDFTPDSKLPVSSSLPIMPVSLNLSELLFYTQPTTQGSPQSDLPLRLQPCAVLHSNSSYRPKKARRRPQLTIVARLDIIQETSEGSNTPSPNTTSSTSSLDFTGYRGFIQPLLTRKASFISDDGNDSLLLVDAEASNHHETNVNSSEIVHVENTNAFFDDDVWDTELDLSLTNSRDSADIVPGPSYDYLVLDILENIKTKVTDLVAHMFDSMHEERTDELIELARDLTWALNEVSRVIASFEFNETE